KKFCFKLLLMCDFIVGPFNILHLLYLINTRPRGYFIYIKTTFGVKHKVMNLAFLIAGSINNYNYSQCIFSKRLLTDIIIDCVYINDYIIFFARLHVISFLSAKQRLLSYNGHWEF